MRPLQILNIYTNWTPLTKMFFDLFKLHYIEKFG